jgi:hypothetical protein
MLMDLNPQLTGWCCPDWVKWIFITQPTVFTCSSLPETSSQTHPEMVLSQLSGYPLIWSSWHLELIITMSYKYFVMFIHVILKITLNL